MKNKIVLLVICAVMVMVLLAGCGKKEEQTQETTAAKETTVETTVETTGETASEDGNIYEDMAGKYMFSSGAGAWHTEMQVYPDGTFEGSYTDSNAGETGSKYPDGTVYYCDFTGKFDSATKVNDYTYRTKIEKIQTSAKAESSYIKDGIKYIATEPYGLDKAKEIQIYTPKAPVKKLPEQYRVWVQDAMDSSATALPFYGIYNVEAEEGWYKLEE